MMNLKKLLKTSFLLCGMIALSITVFAQKKTSNHGNRFEQLGQDLPTPNAYHAADGMPGPDYWQQQADYDIDCTLDTEKQQLSGIEKIKYYNRSPNILKYIWLQLDENQHRADNA